MSKFIKTLLWIFIFLVIVIFVAAAALPSWVSSPLGSRTMIKWINHQIKGKLSIEKIELSWFGNQRLRNFSLVDEKGNPILQFDSFETQTSLLYLAYGGRSFGRTELLQPYLQLTKFSSDLEKDKKKRSSPKKQRNRLYIPQFSNALLIKNGVIVATPPNSSLIRISDIQADLTPSHLALSAATIQTNIRGSLHLDATLDEKLQARLIAKDFPLALLDDLSKTKLYSEAFGPSLNVDLKIDKATEEQRFFLNGSAGSANLSAFIDGTTEKGNFQLSPKTHLDFIITPSFFKELIDEKRRGDWELASKTTLAVQIEKGVFPLSPSIDFQGIVLQAKGSINRAELHHTTLGSYSLKQFDVNVTALNNIEIAYLGDIQGKEATRLAGTLSLSPAKEILFDYTFQGFPVTLLELVSVQLEEKVRTLFGPKFDMEGGGTFISQQLESNFSITSPSTQLNGTLAGNLPEMNFEFAGKRYIYGNKAKIIGSELNFALEGVSKLQESSFAIPFLKGKFFNPYFELDLNGQIGEEGKPFSLIQTHLTALGSLKKLPIEEGLALENGTLFFQVDGPKNSITGNAESQLLKGSFEINNYLKGEELALDQVDLHFNFDLNEFPIDVLAPFITSSLDLPLYLGKAITLSAKGSYTPRLEPRIALDLNAQATGFAASLSISLDGTLIVKQNRPSYIYWEITPERYEGLMNLFDLSPQQKPTFTLTRSTQLELNISQFNCPTTSSKDVSHFLCQSGFVGDITIGTTIFRAKQTNESITFQGTTGSIKGENFSEALNLSLSGQILAPNIPQAEQSTFAFVGQMLNLLTNDGKFNRERAAIKGQLNLDLLPVRQLTGIFPLDNETRAVTQAVLGELVNARLYGEISQAVGPITIDVKSSNFKAIFPLQLQKNALYLRDFVDAEISLTESVNETLLKDINPLIITGAYSNHPLKVYIDPQGFMLPIRPYSLGKVEIGKANFDIGKIRVRNGGQIQSLMQFLKLGEITPDGIMEAWFTPIYMNLHNGVASYKRFDALLGSNVHIAMWGSINLLNDNVNMTLAIAPSTLQQRFKISGLSKQDMFQVQMRGTTGKLELDWSAASTRIALLVAKTATGQIGNIVGGILEKFLLPNLGEAPIPPPTTDPLPWEIPFVLNEL